MSGWVCDIKTMVKLVEGSTGEQKVFVVREKAASIAKEVVNASLEKPPMSLLKKICHPEECKFSTSATRWGTDHEEDALEAYKSIMLSQTEGIDIKKCGLFLSISYPFLRATPDALVESTELNCFLPFVNTEITVLAPLTASKFSQGNTTDICNNIGIKNDNTVPDSSATNFPSVCDFINDHLIAGNQFAGNHEGLDRDFNKDDCRLRGAGLHSLTGQKTMIKILARLGHCCNSDKVRLIETAQAEVVQKLRSIRYPLPLQPANSDMSVLTYFGWAVAKLEVMQKENVPRSLHTTQGIAFQVESPGCIKILTNMDTEKTQRRTVKCKPLALPQRKIVSHTEPVLFEAIANDEFEGR
eukprot:gene14956-6110_t